MDKDNTYPILPLRDIVVYPNMIVPLFVGREKSINALDFVEQQKSKILLVTQRDASVDDPKKDDLYRIGTISSILQLLRLPDGTVKVLVEGEQRVRIDLIKEDEDYFTGAITIIDDVVEGNQEAEALRRSAIKQFEQYVKLNKKIPADIVSTVRQVEDPSKLADMIASHLSLRIEEKQELLEIANLNARLEYICQTLEREIGVLDTERRIRSRVKKQMEKTQKEYYLNEQMKAIQKELGDADSAEELLELEEKIAQTKLTKEAREKAIAELKKLKNMSPMSAEATVVRNYLDWLLGIPWDKRSRLKYDIAAAQKKLDKDHYSLEKVKERIIEHLAVQQRKKKKMRGQILCLVGPPGVGKTSLAKSIAEATGRKFVRMSLGGVRDEAEIRGHRRTYIGSMPGKVIQSMKKAGASNPLFLLDEIDKMGQDFRGDPASAMLEVLDPEQNTTFNDHYLEIDYDLSDVMFITTANTLNMPRPLLDRMEIIRISGYTEDEKVHIAKRHLIPRQIKEHGLKKKEWAISDDALRKLIQHYTRESGVRNLEREIANLTRKAVTEILKKKNVDSIKVSARNLKNYAGVPRFDYHEADKDDHIGVTTGLAYTETGGDLLPIEVALIPAGKGRITLTGKLGEVMQESAQTAWSFVRSQSHFYGVHPHTYWQHDIHVHVPEGATPKDGPSAGAAISTSIVSALTKIPVNKDVAMTGEISLRGMVMPIGGLREKLLAALRGGIKKVLIPEKNVKDLEEIPANVKKGLEIIPVSTLDEVLSHALTAPLQPIAWEDIEADLAASSDIKGDSEEAVKH